MKRATTLANRELAAAGITNPTQAQIDAAMTGGTVTNAQGETTTMPGVLKLRSEGMGWGQIAHTIGVHPAQSEVGAAMATRANDNSLATDRFQSQGANRDTHFTHNFGPGVRDTRDNDHRQASRTDPRRIAAGDRDDRFTRVSARAGDDNRDNRSASALSHVGKRGAAGDERFAHASDRAVTAVHRRDAAVRVSSRLQDRDRVRDIQTLHGGGAAAQARAVSEAKVAGEATTAATRGQGAAHKAASAAIKH
ncbi:MAG TPA: hypothetical protein VLT92_04175 [Burkholderiales bacterium]|nr:hypothetical protein [Burkholderiales bacterium]